MSETNKHRHLFTEYCQGTGLDIGYGGDAITPTAITFDLPDKYSSVGDDPQNIEGDARDLSMFSDNSLSYIFSSHVIEDFLNPQDVLIEWLRVIKPNGYLCLLFPDESIYRQKIRNTEHKYAEFGMNFVTNILSNISKVKTFCKEYSLYIIHSEEHFENDDYNCILIVQKIME